MSAAVYLKDIFDCFVPLQNLNLIAEQLAETYSCTSPLQTSKRHDQRCARLQQRRPTSADEILHTAGSHGLYPTITSGIANTKHRKPRSNNASFLRSSRWYRIDHLDPATSSLSRLSSLAPAPQLPPHHTSTMMSPPSLRIGITQLSTSS